MPFEQVLLTRHASLLGHTLRHARTLWSLLHNGSARETSAMSELGSHPLRVGNPARWAAWDENYTDKSSCAR
eukprot:4963719-Amphidinium_carterae.1